MEKQLHIPASRAVLEVQPVEKGGGNPALFYGAGVRQWGFVWVGGELREAGASRHDFAVIPR